MRNALRAAALAAVLSLLAPGMTRAAQPAMSPLHLPPKTPVITTEQAKHIVAYYKSRERKLFVYNSQAFARGIERGTYKTAQWRPGASQATLTRPSLPSHLSGGGTGGGRIPPAHLAVPIDLTGLLAGLVGTSPNVGDTAWVQGYGYIATSPQYLGNCSPSTNGPAKTRAVADALPTFTLLQGQGNLGGEETYEAIGRVYFYSTFDCSAGYLGEVDAPGDDPYLVVA